MAFGKAVFAEALDLVEAALRKIRVIAARDHPPDHQLFQFLKVPPAAERGHRLAQSVGLGAGELRRIERDLHRLFLEDRHPQRAAEDAGQLVGRAVLRPRRGNFHPLGPAPALEEGVDHIALDRPGANDRHLDHQVIETARAQPRQHVHLRPALDLEHAQRIPLAQHVVNRRVLARDFGEGQAAAMVLAQQVEALPDAGQHPQRQDIDLEDPQRVDVVLVPFDERAVGHRSVADRHGLGQRALGQDEAADVL